jgi:pyruvate dehydrogenase E1 component beta subunit
MPEKTYAEAVVEALRDEMQHDEDVVIMGVDVRASIFGTTRGLVQEFGPNRVIDTPVCEGSFAMAGVGAAMTGLKPVVEIMFAEFTYLAMDAISNMAASWRYVSNAGYKVPMVIQVPCGPRGHGAYGHSQSPQASFLNPPGLKMAFPSTPADVKGLLTAALRDEGPVFVFHHRQLLAMRGEVPEGDHMVPLGKATIRREGNDVTVISCGAMIYKCLEAAEVLQKEGIGLEVIDLRSIFPLDEDLIAQSIGKTNRLVTVEDGRKQGGIGSEIAAMVAESHIEFLDAPILRVAALDTPVPYARTLEEAHFPNIESIISAVRTTLN